VPRPDVGEHYDHQSREIEEDNQPWVPEAVGNGRATHEEPDRRAQCHRDYESCGNAGDSCAEIEGQCA
jgi:hypothetical protein